MSAQVPPSSFLSGSPQLKQGSVAVYLPLFVIQVPAEPIHSSFYSAHTSLVSTPGQVTCWTLWAPCRQNLVPAPSWPHSPMEVQGNRDTLGYTCLPGSEKVCLSILDDLGPSPFTSCQLLNIFLSLWLLSSKMWLKSHLKVWDLHEIMCIKSLECGRLPLLLHGQLSAYYWQ